MKRLGVESFARVLSPLLALLLLLLAKHLLAEFQRVNLLRLAIPLVASLTLIRFVFYVLRRALTATARRAVFCSSFEKVFAAAGLERRGAVYHGLVAGPAA